jgi:hypothetical protein
VAVFDLNQTSGSPRIAANVAKLPELPAEGALIGIAPLNPSRRVRAGRRLICIISNAETADTPDSSQALLKSDEATIDGTIWSPRIFRTPGIVLGLGAILNAKDTDASCNHEQQEPHRRLLMRRNIYMLCCKPLCNEARGIAANVAKLPELLRTQNNK